MLQDENVSDNLREYNRIAAIYTQSAKKVLGTTKMQSEPWISNITWQKAVERKKVKSKLENAKSNRLVERFKEEFDMVK